MTLVRTPQKPANKPPDISTADGERAVSANSSARIEGSAPSTDIEIDGAGGSGRGGGKRSRDSPSGVEHNT